MSDADSCSCDFAHLRYAGYENVLDLADRGECVPWLCHTGFAHVLVAEFRPQVLVELGTFYGGSFFAFCQSVVEHELPTHCIAVDCWEGDAQTGQYGNEVYEFVKKRVDERYAAFVTLKRKRFEDARSDFADGSIDVLHIDGLHTYEAVHNDLNTWISAVRPGGIVIMHDVNEFAPTFGAYKVWDELMSQSEEAHLFRHCHGLGVWRKPGGAPLESALLAALLRKGSVESARVDAYLTVIGERDFYGKRIGLFERRWNESANLAEARAKQLVEAERKAENKENQLKSEIRCKELEKERLRDANLRLQETNAALQRINVASEKNSVEQQQTIAKALDALAENERLLSVMKNTLSWKITAPLRKLSALMGSNK